MKFIIVVVLIALACSTNADFDQDRAVLDQILKHLEAAEMMLAGKSASGEIYRVDYERIRQDLKIITRGLKDSLSTPRREPVAVPHDEQPKGGYVVGNGSAKKSF